MTQSPYLSQQQAADYLGVSERSLERWRVEGSGPRFCRLGHRRVVYRRDDLDAYGDARTFASTSEADAVVR